MSPELTAKVGIWRAKAADGRLTQAEMADAIIALRAGRVGAQIASDTSRRKKAVTAIPTADDLLGELEGM